MTIQSILNRAEQVQGIAEKLLDPEVQPRLTPARIERFGSDIRRLGGIIRDLSDSWDPSFFEVIEPEPPNDPVPPLPGGTFEGVKPEYDLRARIQKNGGSCVLVKQDNRLIANTLIAYGQWMGIDVPKYDPVNGTVGLRVSDCELTTGWAGDHKGWGLRGYDLADFVVEQTNFVCEMPYGKNIEHGFYGNIYGKGLFDLCYFWGIPGQAIQLVGMEGKRAVESANAAKMISLDVEGDFVEIRDTDILECGHFGNGRASFMVSMFDGQLGLRLNRVYIRKTNEPQIHGAILFKGDKEEGFEMLNSRIDFQGLPDREMIQIWAPAYAKFDNCHFQTDAADKGIRIVDPVGPVSFTNCTGDIEVWLGKTVQGAIQWSKRHLSDLNTTTPLSVP